MPVCEEWQALAREFYTDSHKYWPKREDDAAKCAAAADNQKKWNQIARQTRMEQERRGEKPKDGEDLLAAQLAAGKADEATGISCRNLPCCTRNCMPTLRNLI